MNDAVYRFTVTQEDERRVDLFLAGSLADLSRSRIQKLIRQEKVLIDGVPAGKAGQSLKPGQVVAVEIPENQPAALQAEEIPLRILFENKNLAVVDKPAGMVVHPSAGHQAGTLVNAALAAMPDIQGIGGEIRPGIVHRLDKDTSGIILIAKNDKTHQWLQNQFRARKVGKVYLALVDGKPPTPIGRIEAAILRDPASRRKMAVTAQAEKGREAISEYRVLESFPKHSLVEVHPLTGRTHQIRVHLAFLGCPVAGDQLYGYRKSSISLTRHWLHAASLTVLLPDEDQPRRFESPLPAELNQILMELRRK